MPAHVIHSKSAYVWSYQAAAEFIGVSRKTFWSIRNSNTRTDDERRLLTPRIIDGKPAFKKSNLEKFMHPTMNAEDAETVFPKPRTEHFPSHE